MGSGSEQVGTHTYDDRDIVTLAVVDRSLANYPLKIYKAIYETGVYFIDRRR